MITTKHDNQITRIINYLLALGRSKDADVPMLTKKDADILDRYVQLRALYFQYKIKRKAIDMFRGVMRANGKSISESQAYLDFKNMEHVFGNTERVKKEFQRMMVVEAAWENAAKAEIEKDFRAVNGAHSNIIKAAELDKHSPELPDYSTFVPPPVRIAWLPEKVASGLPDDKTLIKYLKKLSRKKDMKFKFEEMVKDDADDAEYSEE